MLEFPDATTFLATIDNLELQVELYDDDFMKVWGHLSEDDIEDKEDELNYNPQQPFIDFENQFSGFKSLRSKIEKQIVLWLDKDILDDNNDPEDHFIFDDELRAVLNEDAQVKIGKSLFQMTRFGYVEVTDASYSTLSLVASTDASKLNQQNVVINGGYYGTSAANNSQSNTSNCITVIDDSKAYYPASKRRIKASQKLKGYSYVFGSKIKAKTIHYKKKRGKWRRRREWITARINGESVNVNCTLDSNQSKNKHKKRRKVKAKIKSSGLSNNWYKTKQQKLKTVHKRKNVTYNDFFFE
jgi:hypothetical protein